MSVCSQRAGSQSIHVKHKAIFKLRAREGTRSQVPLLSRFVHGDVEVENVDGYTLASSSALEQFF